ncbi:hypothetical protein NECAME_13251 [Necator americanus]|uniref:Uncharacterized protein n=1 Tax=Necator americanus TaxID=51031 RepID=W2SZA1_NECAM|nr:hypothetical protein NECAME_13251 [Necator americanus]ETN74027.1 hypothetical protein NECAME_13251 [Necator americanus]
MTVVTDVVQRLRAFFADYGYRFAPAVYVNLVRRDRSAIPSTIDISREEIDSQLRTTLEILASEFAAIDFRKPVPVGLRERASALLERHLSFKLSRKPSTIEGCGLGVFVENGVYGRHALFSNDKGADLPYLSYSLGSIAPRTVVSLYPGTIYDPWDSILLQSIGNHFVLRCRDGVIIDGNDVRLSRRIHRSCSYRDSGAAVSDLSWLERFLVVSVLLVYH